MKLRDISSSNLREIIEIVTHIEELDADGIPVDVEKTILTVRARVDVPSLKRQETLKALGVSVEKSLMFIFRYLQDFDSEVHKIKYKNRLYEVKGIENVEERDLYLNVVGEIKD